MPYIEKFNFDGKYDWRVMELTEEEVEQVTKEHRELSNKIMKECIEDSKEDSGKVATALFEARCPKLYTLIQNKLQEKIKEKVSKQFMGGEDEISLREEKIRFDGNITG